MSSPTTSRIVCFDLGGVLVRICRSWEEACGYAELPYRNPDWMASERARAERKRVVDRHQRGELDSQAYYQALSSALESAYSEAEVERIHEVWSRAEYPGVRELVEDLNRTPGVITACLSNTNAGHWRSLVNEDGAGTYPAVLALEKRLASHLLGCLKPEPRIYALAHAHFFGAAGGPTGNIVFFDDLPENVRAAREAGWTAFEIDPHGDTAAQMRAHLQHAGVLPPAR
jgi:FMN phosphatase YigB (HAD superfamily)